MLKYGMMSMGPLSFSGVNPVLKILQIIFNPWIFFGLSVFVISMASHLYVLSKVDLSFAYPFLSLAYVAVAIFAYFVFREDLNAWRIAGIGFICVGTILIAQSDRGAEATGTDVAGVSMHKSEMSQ
jgi:drug/metabolite transporter (DMT)-like permease